MTRIYTRTGDAGETSLIGGRRAPKADPRVDLYGEIDELNCALGTAASLLAVATAAGSRAEQVAAVLGDELAALQARLFDLGAVLADPERSEALARSGEPVPGVDEKTLERAIDRMENDLEPLRRFILPGGAPAGAALHAARAVCRRAERRTVAVSGAIAVPSAAIRFLNRLSDYLFVAARWCNAAAGVAETVWRPAGGGPDAERS